LMQELASLSPVGRENSRVDAAGFSH
jgi:hypothetical protein